MRIDYLGFAGSSRLESEAAVQLVRLERFSAMLTGCHLAIEALDTLEPAGLTCLYEARLDLVTRASDIHVTERCTNHDPQEAVRRAFALAERTLAVERITPAGRGDPAA